MKDTQKALDIISSICANMSLSKNSKVFDQIYRIAHSSKYTRCSHPGWEEETKKLYIELVESGQI